MKKIGIASHHHRNIIAAELSLDSHYGMQLIGPAKEEIFTQPKLAPK